VGAPAAELGVVARRRARDRWRRSPARAYCLDIGISSWEGLWGRFLGDDEPLRVLREWVPEYRRGAWADALGEYGVVDPDLPGEMAEAFIEARRDTDAPYEDAFAALEALHGTLPMAVLTNGASCLQREKLEGAGLTKWFDAVVVSGDVGAGKPDPRPFHACAARLGQEPGALLMIGDSAERDIAGASAAGWKGLWLDRTGERRGAGDGLGGDSDHGPRVESLREIDLGALREGRLVTLPSSPAAR
ncbi:MAG TPA: HAD family hydrolase, partial [Acidobacteriota bacterium]|nr:HAD family hydrolase [Acidobacteriota bacterium]